MDPTATATDRGGATLPRLLWHRAETSPDVVAYRHPVGHGGRGGRDDAWEDVTWAHARLLAEALAAGLAGLGVEPGDRVAILSRTRVDWVLGHLATLCSGAVTVAIHPACPASEVARIVDGAGAVAVLAEDLDQVEKLRRVRGDIRSVRKVVLFDGAHRDRRVMTWEALLTQGEDVLGTDPSAITRRIDALAPDAPATVLHESGSSATSDRVPTTHAAWVAEGTAAARRPGRVALLRTSLTRHGAHTLLAAQLVRGLATVVDGGAVEPQERRPVDPPR